MQVNGFPSSKNDFQLQSVQTAINKQELGILFP